MYSEIPQSLESESIRNKIPYIGESDYEGLRLLLTQANGEIVFYGEGCNGIVINHPIDDTKVIKIGKPDKDDIGNEFSTHNDIYNSLRRLREMEGLGIDSSVKVPSITFSTEGRYMVMEKILGQTFESKYYIYRYGNALSELGYEICQLEKLTDKQLHDLLEENNFFILKKDGKEDYSIEYTTLENDYNEWWEQEYQKPKFDLVRKIIDLIGLGCEDEIFILDRNAGNIMEAYDGTLYLIDFGHQD